jgi:hypothetical protein
VVQGMSKESIVIMKLDVLVNTLCDLLIEMDNVPVQSPGRTLARGKNFKSFKIP